jgi:hypothetical protein
VRLATAKVLMTVSELDVYVAGSQRCSSRDRRGFPRSSKKVGSMIRGNPTLDDLEQHSIAIEVMYEATASSLTESGSLDREKAAAFLRAAAVDRNSQGNHRAAQLLAEWADVMAQPKRNGAKGSRQKSPSA